MATTRPDPSGRDGAVIEAHRPAIDVARVLALVLVVAGHLVMAVVDRHDGEVRGDNLLDLQPVWLWVAVVAPMPVFFAAAGWANATASLRSSGSRLGALIGVATVVVAVWSVAVLVTWIATGPSDLIGRGARVATQPLWFLAAYVPFVAAGAHLARLARWRIAVVIAVVLVVLASIDVLRFALGAPEGIGWVSFLLAWSVPWLLGGWWRGRATRGAMDEPRTGVMMAVAALVVAVVLVAVAGYSPALIDVSSGSRSNTTPPTLYTAVAGIAQVGVLIALAGALDGIGRRWSAWWDRAGTLAVGVYMWHLTALALCVGLVALGVPVPERLTATWWITRPVWWAAVLALTAGLALATAGGQRWLRHRAPPRPAATTARCLAGVVIATMAAALVGLRGPRSPELAVACTALFVAGWWLLRVRRDGGPATPVSGSVGRPSSS